MNVVTSSRRQRTLCVHESVRVCCHARVGRYIYIYVYISYIYYIYNICRSYILCVCASIENIGETSFGLGDNNRYIRRDRNLISSSFNFHTRRVLNTRIRPRSPHIILSAGRNRRLFIAHQFVTVFPQAPWPILFIATAHNGRRRTYG